uniref:MerR family transcriptional regulator n=1 Tax=Holdemanella biformis TaxID=1735 RepID=UPI003AB19B98
MHYTTGKFAKKAGVTERTLRYYDKIGLLKPKKNDENSYRLYTDEDFVLLQKILVFKSLGFSLDEIRFLIHDNNEIEKSFDIQKKLIKQKITYYTKVYDSLNYTSRLLKNDANALDHLVETVRLLSKQDSLAEQYKNANNLNVRIELHEKYSTNPIKWFDWLYENIDFSKINTLLEVGCGNGQLWMNKRKDIRNREIFLTDVSDGMLEDAKQNLNDNFSFFVVN